MNLAWIGVLLGAVMVGTVQGQSESFSPQTGVAMIEGLNAPEAFVSSMRVDSGDWIVKPVFSVEDHAARIAGFLATARAGTAVGSNYRAVWYERPADWCQEWKAYTFENAEPWDAVKYLKETYGVPDIQDPLWETDATVEQPILVKRYAMGFELGDPLGESVNSLDAESRNYVVELIKGVGSAVADVPFEKSGAEETHKWLIRATKFFESAIGVDLSGEAFNALVATHYNSNAMWPDDSPPVCYDFYPVEPPRCRPEIIYGDWTPTGQLCECTTVGPGSAVCGTFTANASGDIEIRVPWPPPLGSKIKIHVGAGVSLTLCVCVWTRTCYGEATRTRTQINADCTRTELSPETTARMQFRKYYWNIASQASECGGYGSPDGCPPTTQPCDLEIPTPGNTAP